MSHYSLIGGAADARHSGPRVTGEENFDLGLSTNDLYLFFRGLPLPRLDGDDEDINGSKATINCDTSVFLGFAFRLNFCFC